MGIGPMNLGGPGQKQGVHACGTPMNAASGSPITKLTSEAQKQALITGAKNPGFAAAIAKEKVKK
jgi:hypothetical protein